MGRRIVERREKLKIFGEEYDLKARVEKINGTVARESSYKGEFLEYGFVEEYRGLILRARY